MAAECTAAAAKVCRSRLPDGSLQVGGGDIRQNMLQRGERVKMVRSQVDVRKEGRKEVSLFQLLVLLSSQTSGSRTCESKTVMFCLFLMSCPIFGQMTKMLSLNLQ